MAADGGAGRRPGAAVLDAALRGERAGLLRLRAALRGPVAALARAHGLDPDDLEQSVWLRVLEHTARAAPPSDPVSWLRSLALRECRAAALARAAEIPAPLPATPAGPGVPEAGLLARETAAALRSAVARLPGRCPHLVVALADARPGAYDRIAERFAMPRGSIGPVRSRCLACLRRLLHAWWP